MKKNLFAAAAAAILLSSCNVTVSQNDNTPVGEKSYTFSNVAEKVSISVPAEVVLVQGEETKVSVTAKEKTLGEIDVIEEKGKLEIKYNTQKLHLGENKIKIVLATPYIKKLTVNGAADLKVSDYEDSHSVSMEVNGAGDLELHGFKVPSLKIEINGAGDLEATGLECESVKAVINGAGDLELAGNTRTATVDVNGAGSINVKNLNCEKYIRK